MHYSNYRYGSLLDSGEETPKLSGTYEVERGLCRHNYQVLHDPPRSQDGRRYI